MLGLPWWFSGKETTCQCRRCEFNHRVGKLPYREGNSNPPQYAYLGNPMGRIHAGPQSMGCKRVSHVLATKQQQQHHKCLPVIFGIRQECLLSPFLLSTILEILTIAIRHEKWIKGIQIERNKIVFIFRWHNCLHLKNPQRICSPRFKMYVSLVRFQDIRPTQ